MPKQSTLDFLKLLRENNNKEWFEKNRKSFEAAKADVMETTAELIKVVGKWDEGVSKLQPKDCVYRINRDVRFAADKSPYKSNMGAWLNGRGKHSVSAGYYFHLQPGESFLAGGLYMPMPPQLKALRQEIDYNLPEFEAILNDKAYKKQFGGLGGDKLKTTPKEYSSDNPAIDYLKHKSFISYHKLSDELLVSDKFIKYAAEVLKAMQPLNNFLNRAVDGVNEK
jgi:uncharacterized protein (TIGR02453 family)